MTRNYFPPQAEKAADKMGKWGFRAFVLVVVGTLYTVIVPQRFITFNLVSGIILGVLAVCAFTCVGLTGYYLFRYLKFYLKQK